MQELDRPYQQHGSVSYNSGTGVITYTQGNTDTVAEGSSNLTIQMLEQMHV